MRADNKPVVGAHIVWALLAFGMLGYFAVVGAYVVYGHLAYRTFAFDLGIYDQAAWLLSRGLTPFVTVRGLHMFGDHTCFILWPISLIFHVWDNVSALLLLQTAATALGAMAVFLLARDRMGRAAGLCFAAAYLLNPAVENVNLYHFHPESIASAALLFAFYFAGRRRFGTMLLFAALAMLCKDDLAIATGALGLYAAFRWDRRAGLVLLGLSAVWFALCMGLFLPMFNGVGFFRFRNDKWDALYAHRASLGWYLATLFNREAARYLLSLLAPVAFLPLLAPGAFALALPAILINLLSAKPFMITLDYHYTYAINPFIFAAAIEGTARRMCAPTNGLIICAHPLWRFHVKQASGGAGIRTRSLGRIALLAAVLIAAAVGNALWSHLPAMKAAAMIRERAHAARHDATVLALREAARLVPPDAGVSAPYPIAPHFTHRRWIFMFPNPFQPEDWGIRDEGQQNPERVEYIVADLSALYPAGRRIIEGLVKTGQFAPIFERGTVAVYRRIAAAPSPFDDRPPAGHGLIGAFWTWDAPLRTLPPWQGRAAAFRALFPTIAFSSPQPEFISDDGVRSGQRAQFLAVFDGFLAAPGDGEYRFSVVCDGAFRLAVGGRVAEREAVGGLAAAEAGIPLSAGIEPIQLQYYTNLPPHTLRLLWRPPGRSGFEPVPASVLFPSRAAAEAEGAVHQGARLPPANARFFISSWAALRQAPLRHATTHRSP